MRCLNIYYKRRFAQQLLKNDYGKLAVEKFDN